MLEVRLVYEEVGEKLCLAVAPFVAYSLDRGKKETASAEQLAIATVCVFFMEEAVDLLLLIVMAKHGVNALRIRPVFNLRVALFFGFIVAAEVGILMIADQVTWEAEDEHAAIAGNATVV